VTYSYCEGFSVSVACGSRFEKLKKLLNAVFFSEKSSDVESGSPGFTFGFDLNLELLRMSQEGLTSHPPPVVFVEPKTRSSEQRQQAPPTPQPAAEVNGLPPTAVGVSEPTAAEQELVVVEGLHEEEGGDCEYVENGDEDDVEEEEEEEDWAAHPEWRKGGGELFERTDMRNFNYDVIVDFVNQG
jgi:hypothetical protein